MPSRIRTIIQYPTKAAVEPAIVAVAPKRQQKRIWRNGTYERVPDHLRKRRASFEWTAERDDLLKQLWLFMPRAMIAQKLGCNEGILYDRADVLGLKKKKKYDPISTARTARTKGFF